MNERDYKQEYARRPHKDRERKVPYAEDSTKGKSMINPVNYKGDVLVQVWVDSRVLATITRWMDDKGNYPRYMSHAVRRPLEVLAGFLVDNDEVEMVDDTAEARKMLERRFNVDLNRGGRGYKNVLHNMTLSDRRGELGDRISKEQRIFDVYRPKSKAQPNKLVDQAVEKYNELFSKDNKQETSKYFDDYSGIKEGMTNEEAAEVIKANEEIAQRDLDALNSLDLSTLSPVTEDK
jgi:hypothetical protein